MNNSTPDLKSGGKLTSKYLTPCRTFGLKRKSTPQSELEKKFKSENVSTSLKSESPVSRKVNNNPRVCLTPLNCINNKLENQLTPIKHMEDNKIEAQKVTPVTSKNILSTKLKSETKKHCVTPIKSNNLSSTSEMGSNKSLEAQLVAQIKRINEKYGRLEKLKQEEIYTRKHNMLELQKTTEKWMTGFKEIALALHTELEALGRSCSILDILEEHNIPPERVGFNVENLEFD